MKARYIPVGWRQLKHNRLRFFAAVAGITFAVVLMLVQQGFRSALFESGVRWHRALQYEIVILSPKSDHLLELHDFPRNRVFQARGVEGVSAVTPVYTGKARWRNPVDPAIVWGIFMVAFDPADEGFEGIMTPDQHRQIRLPDFYLFDGLSRTEFG
ncbi:MAG: ABC transporter, partial [Halioglobus sp.]|nr:ABC transporter [Halioglobus sp.]